MWEQPTNLVYRGLLDIFTICLCCIKGEWRGPFGFFVRLLSAGPFCIFPASRILLEQITTCIATFARHASELTQPFSSKPSPRELTFLSTAFLPLVSPAECDRHRHFLVRSGASQSASRRRHVQTLGCVFDVFWCVLVCSILFPFC